IFGWLLQMSYHGRGAASLTYLMPHRATIPLSQYMASFESILAGGLFTAQATCLVALFLLAALTDRCRNIDALGEPTLSTRVLFLVIWLCTPCLLFILTASFERRSACFSLVPFSMLIALLVTVILDPATYSRERSNARERMPWSLLVISTITCAV